VPSIHAFHLKTIGATLLLAGCATFQNPYSKGQTWSQGGRPAYAMVEVTNKNSSACDKKADGETSPNCVAYGKVILTRPDSNVSYQFYRLDSNKDISSVITCASPAEVARSLSVSGNVALAASKDATPGGISLSASGGQASTENITALSAQDAATQFVAAASFYNCLAYGSGMYANVVAAGYQKDIFSQAVAVQQAASSSAPPKSGAATPSPPDMPSGTPTAQALSSLPGYASVKFTPLSDPSVTYAVASSTGDGTDTNKGTSLSVHFISGLTTGKAYTFTVTASNSAASSKPSAVSNSITAN